MPVLEVAADVGEMGASAVPPVAWVGNPVLSVYCRLSAIATDSINVCYNSGSSYVGLVGRVLVDLAVWPLVASGLMVAGQRCSELAAVPLQLCRHRAREAGRCASALSKGAPGEANPVFVSHQNDALA